MRRRAAGREVDGSVRAALAARRRAQALARGVETDYGRWLAAGAARLESDDDVEVSGWQLGDLRPPDVGMYDRVRFDADGSPVAASVDW